MEGFLGDCAVLYRALRPLGVFPPTIDDMELWQIAVLLDHDVGDPPPPEPVTPRAPRPPRPPRAGGQTVRHGAGADTDDVYAPSRPTLLGVE